VCRWLDIKFFCVNAAVDDFYFLRGKTASFLDNIANKIGVWNDFCALSQCFFIEVFHDIMVGVT